MSRIEIPGGGVIDMTPPTQGEQQIFQQLQQVTVALNTLAGQLDMLIRIECGNVQKKDVNARIKANDERVRHAIATTEDEVAQKSNSNKEAETDAASDEGS